VATTTTAIREIWAPAPSRPCQVETAKLVTKAYAPTARTAVRLADGAASAGPSAIMPNIRVSGGRTAEIAVSTVTATTATRTYDVAMRPRPRVSGAGSFPIG
jgi:hypothetical protein